jgi:spore coat polysaccharide biosynthesis protein SpsF
MSYCVLITARLKSKRLPKKIIKDINEDNIITFLIKRLKSVFKKKLVVITSKSNQDKILETIAKSEDINIYKGEPQDVIMRMYKAARKFKFKNFISCTADNPFTDANYAKKLMIFHLKKKNDLTIMKGLPIGTFSYAVNTKALKKVINQKLSKNTENWTGYFINNKTLKVGYFNTNFKFRSVSKKLRLTVDYSKDLKFIREILKKTKKSQPTLNELINILEKNPSLIRINSSIIQKTEIKPIFKRKFL